MNYINRNIEAEIQQSLKNNPVTAITGPRQCGKSTLAKKITSELQNIIYLDLERPSDLRKLEDAEWFFSSQKENLFCIDEIQRKPDLFPVIRSLSDEWNDNEKFLILGSASRDLLRQSSESLAGRISYKKLTPFLWSEVNNMYTLEQYFLKGGFPRSIMAMDTNISYQWRQDFISTFLERDLLQWSGFSPQTMRRLWQMLAWINGQTVNYSRLGKSLGVSNVTVRNYIDLLKSTFMLEIIPPFSVNSGKRLVKSPKIYIADTGITCALLEIQYFPQLIGNPVFGSLWEQIVLVNLKAHFPNYTFSFYRTSAGAEIDFIMTSGDTKIVLECKASHSPKLSKGNFNAIQDINPLMTFIVIPAKKGWPMKKGIDVVSLDELILKLENPNYFP